MYGVWFGVKPWLMACSTPVRHDPCTTHHPLCPQQWHCIYRPIWSSLDYHITWLRCSNQTIFDNIQQADSWACLGYRTLKIYSWLFNYVMACLCATNAKDRCLSPPYILTVELDQANIQNKTDQSGQYLVHSHCWQYWTRAFFYLGEMYSNDWID